MSKKTSPSPKILLLDIETAPITAYVWGGYDQRISPDQVITDRFMLSYAAKWLHSDRVFYGDLRGMKKLDDKDIVQQIRDLMDDADVVVAHNGRAFDIRFINGRIAHHRLAAPSPYHVVDTYLVAKKHFNFTFNKLVHLGVALNCKVRKYSHQKFPGLSLWKQCLRGNVEAWKEMERYNKIDVLALQDVYLAMRQFIEGHPNLGIYYKDDAMRCPVCGSDNVKPRGFKSANACIYQQYRCADCGKWSRGRMAVNGVTHKAKQLVV